jgi:hypothetical protein
VKRFNNYGSVAAHVKSACHTGAQRNKTTKQHIPSGCQSLCMESTGLGTGPPGGKYGKSLQPLSSGFDGLTRIEEFGFVVVFPKLVTMQVVVHTWILRRLKHVSYTRLGASLDLKTKALDMRTYRSRALMECETGDCGKWNLCSFVH